MFLSLTDPQSQPLIETPHHIRRNGSVKLSWILWIVKNISEAVDYSYTVIIHNVTIVSAPYVVVNETVVVPNFIFEQCGDFEVQVKAVNRAGESQLSEAVRFSLPLFPDTQPVSDSLTHRVWKTNSEIMVQIIFEVSVLLATLSITSKTCAANFMT